jgi:2'-5' RNA ligase
VRLFVGVALPEALRRELEALASPWRAAAPGLKWVAPELYHLTLRFLGDTDPALLPEIKAALAELAARRPFCLGLGGPLGIPPGRRARVLALALQDEERRLTKLAQAVSRALRPLGFPRETRAYRAHLTLARARRGETLLPALDPRNLTEVPALGDLSIDAFHLYESHLQPGGPIYRVLETVALKG